ncbi:hypothetical protein QQ045_021557 [Rhodiola kirilowii]
MDSSSVLSYRFRQVLKLARNFSFASTVIAPPVAVAAAANVNGLKPLNSKISTFMRNGLVQQAQNLFDEMPPRNSVTYNAMIRGYFQNGFSDHALKLFDKMPERDLVSYNTVIAGLMHIGDVEAASSVFDGMLVRDVVTWNSMVSGFLRNGLIDKAAQAFDVMPVKDVVSWNLMISGLLNSGYFDAAEEYFKAMGAKDIASWTTMLSGYMNTGRIDEACELFSLIPEKDGRVWNAMISGCVRNGCNELAEDLFWKMPKKDLGSWHQIITELMSFRHAAASVRLFMEMPCKCQRTWNSVLLGAIRLGMISQMHTLVEKTPFSDVVSFTNVIIGYFEICDAKSALKAFNLMMPDKDSAAWNATMCGLGDEGEGEEALKLYIRMNGEGASLEDYTFTTVLMICSELTTLHFGKQCHSQVTKAGFRSYASVCNALVTMYARCGNMDSALEVFRAMETRNVISWNSIICGYAHHGYGYRAIKMFRQMRLTDLKPDQITFVGLLSACDHAGLVQNSKHYFNFMKHKCFLLPTTEHYTCIVDLLAKHGLLTDAVSFINQMEDDGLDVPASVWGAVLGACRIHDETDLAEISATKVLETEPNNSGIYMILAEMYLKDGRRSDAKSIMELMRMRGVKKQPGCSWIEANQGGHIFISGDTLHPHITGISSLLFLMHFEMKVNCSFSERVSCPDQLSTYTEV